MGWDPYRFGQIYRYRSYDRWFRSLHNIKFPPSIFAIANVYMELIYFLQMEITKETFYSFLQHVKPKNLLVLNKIKLIKKNVER